MPCECSLGFHHSCHFLQGLPLLHGWFHQAVPNVPILVWLWHSKYHGPSGSAAWWQRGLDLLPLHLAFLQGLAPHPFSIPLIFLSLFKGFFFPKNFLPPFFQRFSWNLCSKAKAFLPKPFSQRLLSKTCFCPLVCNPFSKGSLSQKLNGICQLLS